MPAALRAAFRELYVIRQDGEDMLDFSSAAKNYIQQKMYVPAVRMLQRCAALDPGDPEIFHRLGETCIEAGHYRLAVRYLDEGLRRDPERRYDFEFNLGRAHWSGRRPRCGGALVPFVARPRGPPGHLDQPRRHLRKPAGLQAGVPGAQTRAGLDPHNQRAQERLDRLRTAFWDHHVKQFEAEASPAAAGPASGAGPVGGSDGGNGT